MKSSRLRYRRYRPRNNWRAAFAIDLRSLALVRIGLGLLLVVDLCVRWPDLTAHYSDNGVLPREVLASYYASRTGLWSLHMAFDSAELSAALFAIAAAIAAAFALGYRSRLTGFVSLLLLCSLQARNPLVLSGGDALMRLLLFWLLFLPSGARFSIDALRAKRSGHPSLPGAPHFSVGSAALLLQLAFIYWFSAILKDSPSWRSDGDALFLALSIDQFTTPLGRSMLAWPHGLLRALTLATFWLEVFGPLAAFLTIWGGRLRVAAIVTFLGFHLVALNLTLNLGLFPWVCAVGWLAFLPPAFWQEMLPRWLKKFRRLRSDESSPKLHDASSPDPRQRAWLVSHPVTNLLAGAALVYVLCWNIRTTDFERHQRWFPRQANVIAQTFRIEQYWSMFAPYPMLDDGWYVARGVLADGSDIDLITGRELTWEKPDPVAATYPNQRWRKYCMNLRRERYRDFRGAFVRYLVRRHERDQAIPSTPESKPLIGVELIYMREDTLREHFAETPARPVVIFESPRFGVRIDTEVAASAGDAEPSPNAADSGDGKTP